ncbi:alpha/beta hydrolase [Undibacterium sp.]|uniref:alpha/beta hydrolase n=1 Tax=Undibacterium sp. TaxID=1914977 RepID=UPI0025D847B8|nr:alpha/beta hydrolase [Undibacterium sp.]
MYLGYALKLAGIFLSIYAANALAVDEAASNKHAVAVIADSQFKLGNATIPLYISHDWALAQPEITQAVLMFHGRLRNADVYWRTAKNALAVAKQSQHSMLIVPQFLADADIQKHALSEDFLHWQWEAWMGGEPANGPLPISSFEVIDALLTRLAELQRFPNLRSVVLAGHSGGAQIVQRYAVVGKAEALLKSHAISVRYVVANPSSYLYFNETRPFAKSASCNKFNQWKYGWEAAPVYVDSKNRANYEKQYSQRNVVYLLGELDINPHHSALDQSCAAEMQGAFRLERGLHYFNYLQQRHPTMTQQRIIRVPGIAHDGDAMFESAAGISALFETATPKHEQSSRK